MKTSLDHLPDRTRRRLAFVVQTLREAGPVEMIVLFGSQARGDAVRDLETGYESDYDLLVITKTREIADDVMLWGKATEKLASISDLPSIDVIVHDFHFVNEELKHGQYFFSDIATEGVLLYTSNAFTISPKRAPTPERRKVQAEKDFERFHTSAQEFLEAVDFHVGRGHLNVAAFNLHQVTERFFSAFLLVFTAYMPKIHNIEKLADRAAHLHPDMRPLLPRADPEDERLFELLKKAYVDARYSTKYRITAEELAVLGPRVRELGEVIARLCREKIATLG